MAITEIDLREESLDQNGDAVIDPVAGQNGGAYGESSGVAPPVSRPLRAADARTAPPAAPPTGLAPGENALPPHDLVVPPRPHARRHRPRFKRHAGRDTSAPLAGAPGPAANSAPPAPAPFSIWRRMVWAEARQVEMDLLEAEQAGNPYPDTAGYDFEGYLAEARCELAAARSATVSNWPRGFGPRLGHARFELLCIWSGSEHETAAAALHRAEGRLLMVLPDAAVRSEALKIESIFRDNNDVALTDPRHSAYNQMFDRIGRTGPAAVSPGRAKQSPNSPLSPQAQPASRAIDAPRAARALQPVASVRRLRRRPNVAVAACPEAPRIDPGDRVMLREVRRQQNESWEIARSRIRIFRNILTGIVPFLTVVLVGIAIVLWRNPGLIPLQDVPTGTDAALVESLGAFGGLLSAVASVRALRNFQRFYGLPLAQSILKLPAGAATALAGMILLQHGVLGMPKQQWDLVIPYALAFGIAQIAVTKRIDSRASDLLGDANAKSPATTQTATGPTTRADLG